MATVNLLTLRDRAKQRANMENSSFVSDTEWNTYINYGISQLRDKLIAKNGNDYFATEQSISLVNGTEAYALPSDFYKILYVELLGDDGNYYKMRRFEIAERNQFGSPIGYYVQEIRYRLRANSIIFTPDNQIGGKTVRLTYVPTITNLSANSDTLDGYNGWEEYPILIAARKALIKEEQDVTQLDQELSMLDRRLEEMADNRDQSNPMRVYDSQPTYWSEW
jgi:hypothetical protein